MIKALIFDFDGLIVDTESAWFESYRDVLAYDYGVPFTLNEFAMIVGTTNEAMYDFVRSKVRKPFIVEDFEEKALQLVQKKLTTITPRDGVEDYLQTAKKLGLQIALASSSEREWVEPFLRKLELIDYFNPIITGDMVEKVKPDPALYLKALEALEIAPTEAISFEDSVNGSRAAITAGVPSVIVPNAVTKYLSFADYHLCLSSMAEKPLTVVLDEIQSNVKVNND